MLSLFPFFVSQKKKLKKPFSFKLDSFQKAVEFTGKVFTPVPWSPTTTKGMPQEYEEFAEDTENYIVINVPPTLTFKANVLGKRVCAIYKKVGDAE